MAATTLEERVTILERRMSELEGQVGFLLPLVRQIHLDLLGFKEEVDERFDAIDVKFTRKFEHVDARFDRLEAKVGGEFSRLEAKIDAMPRAVAETVIDLLKKP